MIPSGSSWNRIARNWGTPPYIIAAATPEPSRHMYCLNEVVADVRVKVANEPVRVQTARYAPYSYTLECTPAGLQFRAPLGAPVQITFAPKDNFSPPADLVVLPYWTFGVKDRLVGLSIEHDFHVQTLATVAVLMGLILFSAATFVRSKSRRANK